MQEVDRSPTIVGDVGHLDVAATHALVTTQRHYRLDTDGAIEKPYVARASHAPSIEHPFGSPEHREKHKEYVSIAYTNVRKSVVIEMSYSLSYSSTSFSGTATVMARYGQEIPTLVSASSGSTSYSPF